MKFIAVNTAAAVEVALYDGSYLKDENFKCASAELMPYIDGLLCGKGMSLADLDYIACVNGPGSFTGIRIGISAVRSMCYALNKPALPIHYMQMLAYNENADGKSVLALSDGSNGTAYACEFNERREFIKPCVCIKTDEAVALAQNYDGAVCADPYMHSLIKNSLPPQPDCRALIRAARMLGGKTVNYRELVAEYVREPQAERDLRVKNNG